MSLELPEDMQKLALEIENRLKLQYLTQKVEELSNVLKDHMKSEDSERKAIDRKLLGIGIVVLVDALFPGGGAALLKFLI